MSGGDDGSLASNNILKGPNGHISCNNDDRYHFRPIRKQDLVIVPSPIAIQKEVMQVTREGEWMATNLFPTSRCVQGR